MRDVEYSELPESGARRILALGDSQTFGIGIAVSDTWPSQLEQRLSRTVPAFRWEVINAGIPATDTWQHELLMYEFIESIHPDIVLLAIYVNDVTPGTGVSQLDLSSPPMISRDVVYLLKRSALVTALLQAREPLRALLGRPSSSSVSEKAIVEGTTNPLVGRGWDQVRTSLAQMENLARSRHIAFGVVIIPRRDQITSPSMQRSFDDKVQRLCSDLSIPSIDTLPSLHAAYHTSTKDLFIPWDGHNTASANELIAKAIVQELGERFFTVRR
jgi:lysophospholipase L1-like esterase